MKTCSYCKEDKPSSEFFKNSKYKDGLSSRCKACQSLASSRSYKKKKETIGEENFKELRKTLRKKYVETIRAYTKTYRLEHLDELRTKDKAYKEANPDKVHMWRKDWREKNLAKSRKSCRDRVARKLKATPSWANQSYMELFYECAKLEEERTGRKCHVDHIVPLKSDLVCGLHVEDNLQILFLEDNISKSNRSWPDMP